MSKQMQEKIKMIKYQEIIFNWCLNLILKLLCPDFFRLMNTPLKKYFD